MFEEGVKYNGPIPQIKYLPTHMIDHSGVAGEVRHVSDEVAKNMDFSTPVQATAFRYGRDHDEFEPSVNISDGHHRLAAAKQTGRPHLPVEIIARNAKGEKLNAMKALSDEIEKKLVHKADGGDVDGITAYHGSPHDFDEFDTSKIGTGEGAQSYGHGLYFAGHEPVAKGYRDALSGDPISQEGVKPDWRDRGSKSFAQLALAQSMDKKLSGDDAIHDAMQDLHKNAGLTERKDIKQRYYDAVNSLGQMLGKEWDIHKGHMYEVHINAHPDHMLDWDKPLREQHEKIRRLAGWTAEHEAAHKTVESADNDNLLAALEGNGDYTPAKLPPRPHGALPLSATGADIYEHIKNKMGAIDWPIDADRETREQYRKSAAERTSQYFLEHGIKGIKYQDAGSRGAGQYDLHVMYKGKPHSDPIPMMDKAQAEHHAKEYQAKGYDTEVKPRGTHNYVVFDHNDVRVKRKYATGGFIRRAYQKGGKVEGSIWHARDAFDEGGDVRTGDSVGGLRGDTGAFATHDVGEEQGKINEATAAAQSARQGVQRMDEAFGPTPKGPETSAFNSGNGEPPPVVANIMPRSTTPGGILAGSQPPTPESSDYSIVNPFSAPKQMPIGVTGIGAPSSGINMSQTPAQMASAVNAEAGAPASDPNNPASYFGGQPAQVASATGTPAGSISAMQPQHYEPMGNKMPDLTGVTMPSGNVQTAALQAPTVQPMAPHTLTPDTARTDLTGVTAPAGNVQMSALSAPNVQPNAPHSLTPNTASAPQPSVSSAYTETKPSIAPQVNAAIPVFSTGNTPLPPTRPADLGPSATSNNIFDQINAANLQRAAVLESQPNINNPGYFNSTSGLSKEQWAKQMGADPNMVQTRLVDQGNGMQPDYYTKGLDQVFGEMAGGIMAAPGAIMSGIGNAFSPQHYDPITGQSRPGIYPFVGSGSANTPEFGNHGGGQDQTIPLKPKTRKVKKLMPDGTYQWVDEPYKKGGGVHNSQIVDHVLTKFGASLPASNHPLFGNMAGRRR